MQPMALADNIAHFVEEESTEVNEIQISLSLQILKPLQTRAFQQHYFVRKHDFEISVLCILALAIVWIKSG